MIFTLEGRNAILTGASQGLGREIAKEYIQAGANVLLCARDKELLSKVRSELKKICKGNQVVDIVAIDVSDPASLELLLEKSASLFPELHILVNNAGVYGPIGRVEDNDWCDWVRTFEVNLYASVLLCKAVVPHFIANSYGKIIQLSGGGATSPLPRFSAYAASKAAVVRFAETLAEELREFHIDVNSIAPGALNTRLLEQVLEAGPESTGEIFFNKAIKQKNEGGIPLSKGARLAVFLGSSQSDGITGKLISAVWDPWEKLPELINDLQKTDVYTLRRIVPEDRNLGF